MSNTSRRRLLVVTGPMRSGTTLLGNMLHGGSKARHEAISFVPDTVTDLRDITPIAAAETSQALPLMNAKVSDAFLSRWGALARSVLPVFEQKVLDMAPAAKPEIYGGKLTGLLPELLALSRLPDLQASFLILDRDPRDIFASALRRYGNTSEAPSLAFMNAALGLDYAAVQVPNSMVVAYSDLVTNPVETMGAILDFVGVERSVYDWASIEADLISNSSFIGIGPDDLLHGVGIRPSVGEHRQLDPYHSAAFAEFFDLGERPGLRTRIRLYEEFLPQVIAVARRYGYAMHGLLERASIREGSFIPMVRLVRSAGRRFADIRQR